MKAMVIYSGELIDVEFIRSAWIDKDGVSYDKDELDFNIPQKKLKICVGDVVKQDDLYFIVDDILLDKQLGVTCLSIPYCGDTVAIDFSSVKVSNKTLKEINESILEPNHLHYSKSKRKIIHWFLPFDKCLMRNSGSKWFATYFSHYDNLGFGTNHFVAANGSYYDDCLPYNEKTAKLIGTTDDWEEEIV